MPIYVERPATPALWNLCREATDRLKPGSPQFNAFGKALRQIVLDDHDDMLLRGVDRYGKPRALLAPSTLANKKRGPGPSLIPRGRNSRFFTNFTVTWSEENGVMFLVARYRDILSNQGKPFAQYHMTGARKPGTRWVLPRRDTGGTTPKGWHQIRVKFRELVAQVLGRTGR